MHRSLFIPILAFFALPISIAVADPPATSTPPSAEGPPASIYDDPNAKLTPDDEASFKALVAKGDRARLSFDLGAAAKAYKAALEIRQDPIVYGRLGLVIIMARQPALDYEAATDLYEAVSETAGANEGEKALFWESYRQLRRRVCKLNVASNEIDAIIYRESSTKRKRGGAFWTFINPGITRFHGILEGHESIDKDVECINGREVYVRFDFVPDSSAAPPPAQVETVIIKEVERAPQSKPDPPVVPRAPKVAQDGTPLSRFRGGIGPAIVFGAAPSASVGVSITGQYRRQGLSAIAIARGAWALGDIRDVPLDVFSASAVIGPCAQWEWIDACAFGGATLLVHSMNANRAFRFPTKTNAVPVIGLGIGATYPINYRLSARLFADAAALTDDFVVRVVSAEGDTIPIWQTQRFMFGVSASLMFGR